MTTRHTSYSQLHRHSGRRIIPALLCLSVVTAIVAAPPAGGGSSRPVRVPIRPAIPTADRTSGSRVFLEHADEMRKVENDSFTVVAGNVCFSKGPMMMYCDSAHYFAASESLDAFSNVRMEQGDTLFVYADELNYDGPAEIAYLYADEGKNVRMINRDVKLETDAFVYDLGHEVGYYTTGGVLTDKSNRLVSTEGEYVPATKDANFYSDVHLNSIGDNDTLDIFTDSLFYNTDTHIAVLHSPSTVINSRGTIYTSNANYNTDTNYAELFDRSLVVTSRGNTLVADSIYYDHAGGFGTAYGSMVLTDSVRQASVSGDYGYYNEVADSAFVTGRSLIKEYSNGDTLYMHGRYIETFIRLDTLTVDAHIEPQTEMTDSTAVADSIAPAPVMAAQPATKPTVTIDTCHIAVVYPRVRFYRSDLQGLCDSLRFVERDSTAYLYRHPVVWSEDQQITGNEIHVHLNDSTIDHVTIPSMAFATQHIEDEHYNQLSGKSMVAYLTDGQLKHLDISGNVEIIMYPEESDSTINKIVNAESSYLSADFEGRTTNMIKMWPETSGTATPMFLAKKSLFYLPKFKWYGDLRPTGPDDVFIIPPAMEDLMSAPDESD